MEEEIVKEDLLYLYQIYKDRQASGREMTKEEMDDFNRQIDVVLDWYNQLVRSKEE